MVEQGPGRGRGVSVGAPDIDSLYPLYTPSPRPLLRRARRREQRASAYNHCPAYEMHAGRRSLVGRLSKRGMPEKRSEVSASEEAPSECGSPDGSPRGDRFVACLGGMPLAWRTKVHWTL